MFREASCQRIVPRGVSPTYDADKVSATPHAGVAFNPSPDADPELRVLPNKSTEASQPQRRRKKEELSTLRPGWISTYPPVLVLRNTRQTNKITLESTEFFI